MGCFSSFLLSRSYCAAFLAFVWPLGFGISLSRQAREAPRPIWLASPAGPARSTGIPCSAPYGGKAT